MSGVDEEARRFRAAGAVVWQGVSMERVTGVGGVFFRAHDPELLTRWYAEHLGVDPPPASYDGSSWRQRAGPTVFAAMPTDSEHFGDRTQQWAVNFRVE